MNHPGDQLGSVTPAVGRGATAGKSVAANARSRGCRLGRGLALALTVLGAACGSSRPKPVDFSEAAKSYRAEDYDRVREEWTRHHKLVRDVGTILEVWVTFKGADFRQAYVEQYAQTYGLPGEERAHLRTAQLEAAKTATSFIWSRSRTTGSGTTSTKKTRSGKSR